MKDNRIRKLLSILVAVMMAMAMLPGCGGSEEEEPAEDPAQTEDTQQTDVPDGADQSVDDDLGAIDVSKLGGDGADVDVSKLSATMVYSVVNDMLTRPNAYMGKSVRITGAMSSYYDEETGNTYYACFIQDATACCAQGIEFVTTDDYDPADYPADGEEITVKGTYDLYDDNGVQYAVLKDAVFE